MSENVKSKSADAAFDSASEILCDEIREAVSAIPDNYKKSVQEIRLRSGKPIALTDGTSTLFIDSRGRILFSEGENALVVSQRNIFDTFKRLCGYSVYSYQNQIKNGFITIRGGHRVGLCGTAVISEGSISAVNDISSLNIRISRQIFGVSDEIIKSCCPLKGGIIIIGAPSSGKTTILRDLAYRLSLGIECKRMRTSVIDERGELSGTFHGSSYNDLGLCDVLNGYPKGEGIIHAVRSLSPQVIICDEIGSDEDCRMAVQGFNSGAYIIASVHAFDFEEFLLRPVSKILLASKAFRYAAVLGSSDRPGIIKEIRSLAENEFARS